MDFCHGLPRKLRAGDAEVDLFLKKSCCAVSSARVTPELPKVAKHLLNVLPKSTSNVVSFSDESCSDGALTGGKASSLAVLTNLASESDKVSFDL